MQSHLSKVLSFANDGGRGGAAAWGTSVRSCGSACEQFVLLRPVQRQIEVGQPRRGKLDGLPPLQDRLDQLRAQEGEANSWSDRARPVASSSNHARPRAIALISAGSHLELCFCCANPGRTNLVSAPRRMKAAAAVSSTAQSLAASDAHDGTSPPNRRPRRSLMMIAFSSTMIFSTSVLRLTEDSLWGGVVQ